MRRGEGQEIGETHLKPHKGECPCRQISLLSVHPLLHEPRRQTTVAVPGKSMVLPNLRDLRRVSSCGSKRRGCEQRAALEAAGLRLAVR